MSGNIQEAVDYFFEVLRGDIHNGHSPHEALKMALSDTAEVYQWRENGKESRMGGDTNKGILLADLQESWKHAVRAYNFADNCGMRDTKEALAEVIVGLSQLVEFELSK